MNDYKELLDALDGMDFFCDRAGKELWFDKPKEVQDEDIAFHHETLMSAIKAIEQLVKERDAAIADLKINWLCAVCKNRVVAKEWMACKNKDFCEAPCGAPTCLNFEWRGVQEESDEKERNV